MQIWSLDHPKLGRVEVRIAPLEQLEGNIESLVDDAEADVDGDELGAELLIDGRVVSRVYDLENSLAVRRKEIGPDTWDNDIFFDNYVDLSVHAVTDEVYSVVLFFKGSSGVELDAPAGSAARRWQERSDLNPCYAVVQPLLSGVGAGLIAFISLVVFKLIPFLPDPSSTFAQWLDVGFGLFDQQQPQWLEQLVSVSGIWLPILIGVATALASYQTAINTSRQKEIWRRDAEEEQTS